MNALNLITIDPDILGEAAIFKGTRVPVKALLDYLEAIYNLEDLPECFPSVTREMSCQWLECAEAALLAPA